MAKRVLYSVCCLCLPGFVSLLDADCAAPFLFGGAVPAVWRHEQGMGRLGKGRRKSSRGTDTQVYPLQT